MSSSAGAASADAVREPVGDIEMLGELWQDEILGCRILIKKKPVRVEDLTKWIRSVCNLDTGENDPNLAFLKRKEQKIGNALQEIQVALTHAQVAQKIFQEQRKGYLYLGADKGGRRNRDVIESTLLHEQESYRKIRQLGVSADMNVQVLSDLRQICYDALDRIRQMSMLLGVELKHLTSGSLGD